MGTWPVGSPNPELYGSEAEKSESPFPAELREAAWGSFDGEEEGRRRTAGCVSLLDYRRHGCA